ncbi:hypothetical protein ACWD04_27855 [Streptomyces sp. NPDC002911]
MIPDASPPGRSGRGQGDGHPSAGIGARQGPAFRAQASTAALIDGLRSDAPRHAALLPYDFVEKIGLTTALMDTCFIPVIATAAGTSRPGEQ